MKPIKKEQEVEKIADGIYKHIKREWLWDDDGYMILRTTITQKDKDTIVTDTYIKVENQLQLERASLDELRNVPNWAKWSMAETVSYIDENVTDLQSAKVVLKNMAKIIIALRNRVFSKVVLEE